jgi:hypothetical protein
MSKYLHIIIVLLAFSCNSLSVMAQSWLLGDERYTRSDTIKAVHVDTNPVIDGIPFDRCWEYADWYPINVPWMLTDATGTVRPAFSETGIASNDFEGQYKIMWSATSNKMYMLVRVVDDKWVTGYQSGSNFFDFDELEMYIDAEGPCRTGSRIHTFNNKAYTFRIMPSSVKNRCQVYDLFSTTENKDESYYWQSGDYTVVNFKNNYDVVINRMEDEHVTYFEMSFDLLDDYKKSVRLNTNRVLGFSLAYSDSDNPVHPARTAFIGSIELPFEHTNDSYRDASFFGTLQLTDPFGLAPLYIKRVVLNERPIKLDFFPNPTAKFVSVSFSNGYRGPVEIRFFNILGKQVSLSTVRKSNFDFAYTVSLSNLLPGFYMMEIRQGKEKMTYKLKKE